MPRPRRPRAASAPQTCCATPSAWPRPASTRRKISDLYSRTVTAHIFEALYHYDHLARPVQDQAADRGGAARGLGRLPPASPSASGPASCSPTTRPSRARSASWWRRTMSTPQALCRPGQQGPAVGRGGGAQLARPGRAAPAGAGRRAAVRLRHASCPACGRSTATRCSYLDEPRPRLVETLADNGLYGAVAREVAEAYGDKHAAAPGGHRRLPPRELAAQLGDRAGAQPQLPRALLRGRGRAGAPTTPRARPCWRASRAGACRCSTGWWSSIIEEQQPRWLAFLNRQQDFIERVPEEFTNIAMPGGKVAPNLAKQGIVGYPHRRRPRAC